MKFVKRISLGLSILTLSLSIFCFSIKRINSISIHPVSNVQHQTKIFSFPKQSSSVESKKVEPLVAKVFADEKEYQESTLGKTFPNLVLSGDISPEHLLLISKVLLSLPAEKLQSLNTLRIRNKKGEKRGLGGTNTIIINAYKLSNQEFVAVLVHELGHIIDLGGLRGSPLAQKSFFNDGPNPIYNNDLSVIFYNYSWQDSVTRKVSSQRQDFVSGYAMTDPFEDFAESFIYYVYHNQEFQILAENNEVLRLKYDFINQNVFAGETPQTGSDDVNVNKRVWDATKIPLKI